MALAYFAEFGWEPLILKINPDEQEGIKDPELCRTVPDEVKTWQAGCLPLWLTKWTGLRNIGLRSFFHLAKKGNRIIQQEKPQAVFFSTTMFSVMTLGRYWQRRHGIPYVLDFQDPWFKGRQGAESREENAENRGQRAEVGSQKTKMDPQFRHLTQSPHPQPLSHLMGEGGVGIPPNGAESGERRAENGGQSSEVKSPTSGLRPPTFKGKLADWVAGILEPYALRRAAHVVSVSPAYPVAFRARYSWLGEKDFTVLPFGAAETDFEHLHAAPVRQTIFNPRDGKQHWVYVGRGGRDMNFSVRSFFAALARVLEKQPTLRPQLMIHFIGTCYAPKERALKTVEPLALEYGLGDVVIESTDRIPYFEALQCLLDSDALFIPGSDDPSYTASKLYPYILAKKPLLAVFHEASSVVEILKKTKAGTVVAFKTGESVETISKRILESGWLPMTLQDDGRRTTDDGSRISNSRPPTSDLRPPVPATDWTAFAPYTAREMTRQLCQVFDAIEKQKCSSLVYTA